MSKHNNLIGVHNNWGKKSPIIKVLVDNTRARELGIDPQRKTRPIRIMIKTFKDLEFRDRPEFTSGSGNTRSAYINLGNNVEMSVVDGDSHYSNPGETYEVAVFHRGHMLNLKEYEQVLGWQDAREVELLMKDIQTNPRFVNELREKYGETY